MELFVNGEKIDITLEDEKTVGEVLKSFEKEAEKAKPQQSVFFSTEKKFLQMILMRLQKLRLKKIQKSSLQF